MSEFKQITTKCDLLLAGVGEVSGRGEILLNNVFNTIFLLVLFCIE